MKTVRTESNFRPNESKRIQTGARTLSDIVNSGLEFNASYQRSDVWGIEDKQALIESVFTDVDLGSVLFAYIPAKISIETNKDYEVIDGKQRLSTISSYMCDEFDYKGYKYSELSKEDQRYFRSRTIRVGILPEESSLKERAQAFLTVNSTGVPQSKDHLMRVKAMIEGME